MRLFLFALALLSAPAFAQTPEALRPGDVDVSDIAPYSYEYEIYVSVVAQGMFGQPFGSATESLSVENGVMLSVTNITAAQGNNQTDSTWMAWPTLEPIREASAANAGQEYFDFSPTSVSGVTREGTAVDVMLDAPVFSGGVVDLIARRYVLEEGATVSYVSFDGEAPDTPKTTILTAVRQQEVLGRQAWIVTAVNDETRTFAFDAETGETLTVEFSPQPGVSVELRRSDLEAAE